MQQQQERLHHHDVNLLFGRFQTFLMTYEKVAFEKGHPEERERALNDVFVSHQKAQQLIEFVAVINTFREALSWEA